MNLPQLMAVFVRVAELGSFSRAAEQLGQPKASVSTAVMQLEAHLGTRLLQRTTRRVQLTQDGQACLERCRDLLADIDEWQTQFQTRSGAPLQGRVRVDMSTGLARYAVVPRLPELLQRHPALEIELSSTERRVDLLREGFDCVLRAGEVGDTQLAARRLGELAMLNCASPDYLARHGTPTKLDDLARHRLIHFVGVLGTRSTGFDFEQGGQVQHRPMAGTVTVNNAEAYAAACLAGLGLIQVPWMGVQEALAQGRLVAVLPQHRPPALPVHLLYPHRRHVPARVRVVMDWLVAVVTDHLGRQPTFQ